MLRVLAGAAGRRLRPLPARLRAWSARSRRRDPFFVDERLNRTDIRSDPATGAVKAGLPLAIAFRVSRIQDGRCTPLPGAVVDIWHCDALGAYSDVGGGPGQTSTRGQKFLRGYQVTDASGVARFSTIYPGWYQGRAVHVHFTIRAEPGSARGYEFTSQLYIDETITDQVPAQAPYNQKGRRDRTNEQDGIFGSGGADLLLPLTKAGSGYAGTFDIALQTS